MATASGGNIKVVVRVRPFNTRELDRNAKCVIQMKDGQTILHPPTTTRDGRENDQKVFAFDKSYWSFDRSDPHYAGQGDLHDDLGRPLLDNAFKGYNNCILAYGQSGAGKSFSMMGYGSETGVIPKICQEMYDRITSVHAESNLTCTVEVSYLEIYNEKVRDLLNPSTKGNLKVREHPSTGPYVEDLAKLVVGNFKEIEQLMDEGNKARTVAATNMNETSSRSHAVFTLTLTQKTLDVDTKLVSEKVAKISLVDLAGSERAVSTGATGARLKEGAEINRSLSALGRVIGALADLSSLRKKKGSAGQVPYRDSVLTWLLKDSLGGNSMTAMIAAISPADINYDETLSTLRYADSAKRIKNHAVINEDANARMVRELKAELAQLRSQLGTEGTEMGAHHAKDGRLSQQFVTIVQADGAVKTVSKAELADQLSQSEKLYVDLNQTWEEKLQKTEGIHKEREAALEELGISIEKGFVGLHMPKKMPHLVNLSDDPLLAECLVYNLKPGITTVGNVDSSTAHPPQIRLNGSEILQEHCTFENAGGIVTVSPKREASVMVNGKIISDPVRLRSGCRIILGGFHIFRFNHPMEARAERSEVSLLRRSVTTHKVGSSHTSTASPSPRAMHGRTISSAASEDDWESSRPASPVPVRELDSEWSFARREAAGTILGPGSNIADLTDDELNLLLENVQKARAKRNLPDDDFDSSASHLSLDHLQPQDDTDDLAFVEPDQMHRNGGGEDGDPHKQKELRVQGDTAQEEAESIPRTSHAADVEISQLREEKARLAEKLRNIEAGFARRLAAERQTYEAEVQNRTVARREISGKEVDLARKIVKHWRSRRSVRIAEDILRYASYLKEAQIMSLHCRSELSFQFVILDSTHVLSSPYDMVLASDEHDDAALEETRRPCVVVRVIDFKHHVIRLWSLEKLTLRIHKMRDERYRQAVPDDSVEQSKPRAAEDVPQYTLVGDSDVPLRTVFQSKVQDLTVDVWSPYTFDAIGSLRMSLEPSARQGPSDVVRFNVVLHAFYGYAEREGTQIHAQMWIPGTEGVTTSQLIANFDEGPVRWGSVHGMSLPSHHNDFSLRVSIFAKATEVHLEKLLSWDEMREENLPKSRVNESQFSKEECRDVFVMVRIMELEESGDFKSAEVLQTSETDEGSYQLHHGLQRRVVVTLTSCGELKVSDLKISKLRLIDHVGRESSVVVPDSPISLHHLSTVVTNANADGTTQTTVTAQWDSSVHRSALFDRTTPDKHRVRLCLSWCVYERASTILEYDMCAQILPRSVVSSAFSMFWHDSRILHSTTALYTMVFIPAPVKTITELWRMDTRHDYVKGEEALTSWRPRGVSLLQDYLRGRRRRLRRVNPDSLEMRGLARSESDKNELLANVFKLWIITKDPAEAILQEAPKTYLQGVSASVTKVTKSMVTKGGYLLTPTSDRSRWVKRFVELRRPYLYLYSGIGEEVGIVSLRNSRVDSDPKVEVQRRHIFAIYGTNNTWLFVARNAYEKTEWIFRIDQAYSYDTLEI